MKGDSKGISRGQSLVSDGAYLRWFAGDTAGELGGSLRSFVIPLATLMATGDTRFAGIVAFAGTISLGVSDLVGGYLADKHNRIKLLAYGAAFGLLIAGTWTALSFTNIGSIGILFLALNIAMGLRYGFASSASTATLVEILPSDKLGRALSANQGRDAIVQLLGAPIGGLLLGISLLLVPPVIAFCEILGLVSYLLLLGTVRQRAAIEPADAESTDTDAAKRAEQSVNPAAPSTVAEETAGLWHEMTLGFRWLFTHRIALSILGSSILLSMGIGVVLTTQVYSLQRAGVATAEIGLLSTAMGAGMLCGSMLSGRLVPRIAGAKLIIVSALLILATSGAMIVTGQLWVLCLLLVVGMLGVPLYNALGMGMLMLMIPQQNLGRVNSAATLFSLSAASLPALAVGFLLPALGRELTTAAGVGLLVCSVLLILSNSLIRGIPREADWADYVESFHVREQ